MASETRFALAVGWRALLIAALGVIALEMSVVHRQYAGAVVALTLIAVTVVDLARQAGRADRLLSQFIGAVTAADMEWPGDSMPGFQRFKDALAQAHDALAHARAIQHRDTDYLRALVDTTAAALFTVVGTSLVPANRAARRLIEPQALGAILAARLTALEPGERCVVRLPAGPRALATAARFTAQTATRLVALQTIEGELDAAEVKAWQDLSRILAHEMMNSLTPVASLAESLKPLVADGPLDVTDAIEVIGNRSEHLMRFVERYRAASELPVPVVAPVPIAELFAAIEALFRGTADLIWDVQPADLCIACDRELIEQALINLVRNAAYAVSGRPAPVIKLAAQSMGDEIMLIVSDNGAGIPSDLLDRVFVPFFTTKPDGSGIGLSLVRQIAVSHGGRAEADSSADGTTIRLSLPAMRN